MTPSSTTPRRIVILIEGHSDPVTAKTAVCLLRYRAPEIVALFDRQQAGNTAQELFGVGGNIPVIGDLAAAPEADTLLVGIAPAGGQIPPTWRPILLDAIARGMDLVSGLHDFLCDDPELVQLAKEHSVRLIDVRQNNERDVANRQGIRNDCLRIHTVGNDCSVGKMVVAVEVARALQARGHDAKFVATGQTGILVEGDGCPIDCVVSDFLSGAVEKLVLANQHHEILLIEGQGSINHPRYSAVTLGLLHGAMPHGLILCYEVGRKAVRGMESIPLVPLAKLRDTYEIMANLMHPCRVIGIGMNSRLVSDAEADAERKRLEAELGLPVCDVVRHGPDVLVEAVLRLKKDVI
jgi:uncharacterized NAD-dependent epimerase/dehydratase family protein